MGLHKDAGARDLFHEFRAITQAPPSIRLESGPSTSPQTSRRRQDASGDYEALRDRERWHRAALWAEAWRSLKPHLLGEGSHFGERFLALGLIFEPVGQNVLQGQAALIANHAGGQFAFFDHADKIRTGDA